MKIVQIIRVGALLKRSACVMMALLRMGWLPGRSIL